MDWASIPDDVKRFILISIPSIPYLEAMLLLRENTIQEWDHKHVAKRLYVSEKAAAGLLAQLHASGVLTLIDQERLSYRYQPQSEDLKQMIDRLAETYAKHLVDVTSIIHSQGNKKAQKFADAFLWRKDP